MDGSDFEFSSSAEGVGAEQRPLAIRGNVHAACQSAVANQVPGDQSQRTGFGVDCVRANGYIAVGNDQVFAIGRYPHAINRTDVRADGDDLAPVFKCAIRRLRIGGDGARCGISSEQERAGGIFHKAYSPKSAAIEGGTWVGSHQLQRAHVDRGNIARARVVRPHGVADVSAVLGLAAEHVDSTSGIIPATSAEAAGWNRGYQAQGATTSD